MASLQDALAWAARGFRIFPCIVGDKKPAIAAFPVFATTDAQQIQAWWNLNPDYNIGVLTNNLVVVDVDMKRGKDGLSSFRSIGGTMETLVVETPSGGYHVYYTGPDSKLAVDIVHGVDVRSHNGYVLAPGSFVIDARAGIAGDYRVKFDRPLVECPASIQMLLERPGARRQRSDAVPEDAPSAIAAASVWLDQQPPAIEGQGGDILTYQIAAALVRDYALSNETAYALMAERWNPKCQPHPWPLDLLWQKIQNADEYATGSSGSKTPDSLFAAIQIPEARLIRGELGFGNAIEIKNVPKRPWVIPGLLLQDDITTQIAAGGRGKSIFQIIVAAHLAVGRDIAPSIMLADHRPQRSVIYNAEDNLKEQSRRLSAVCTAYSLPFEDVQERIMFIGPRTLRLFLATGSRSGPTVNEAVVATFISLLKSQPDVTFAGIDPLRNIHGLQENDSGHMEFLYDHVLRRICEEAGVSMMVAQHAGKQGDADDQAGNYELARGSSAIINSSRIAFTMVPPTIDDMNKMHLTDEDAARMVRIDDAKANVHEMSRKPRWFMWETVKLLQGDTVGVIKPMEADVQIDLNKEQLARMIADYMFTTSTGSVAMTQIINYLKGVDPIYARTPTSTMRSWIEQIMSLPYSVTDDQGRVAILQVVRDHGSVKVTMA